MTNAFIILATLLYCEARGEGQLGIEHVASVVWNSSKVPGNPESMVQEVLKPGRYSSMRGGVPEIPENMSRKDLEAWMFCISTALKMTTGEFTPRSNATHFYNPEYADPKWAAQLVDSYVVGRHRFGKLTREGTT